ncbi:hypothetical protein MRX96_022541 [Rhipicephalus microplus]
MFFRGRLFGQLRATVCHLPPAASQPLLRRHAFLSNSERERAASLLRTRPSVKRCSVDREAAVCAPIRAVAMRRIPPRVVCYSNAVRYLPGPLRRPVEHLDVGSYPTVNIFNTWWRDDYSAKLCCTILLVGSAVLLVAIISLIAAKIFILKKAEAGKFNGHQIYRRVVLKSFIIAHLF